MKPITIRIPGQPQAKERARSRIVTPRNGKPFVTHYTPPKTVENERNISLYAVDEMCGGIPFDCPIHLHLTFRFEIPKSWPQWKKDLALSRDILPTTKPDLDNVEKSVKDALNGIVWKDDCYVVSCEKMSYYSEKPCIVITVMPINKHSAQITKRPREDKTVDVFA